MLWGMGERRRNGENEREEVGPKRGMCDGMVCATEGQRLNPKETKIEML